MAGIEEISAALQVFDAIGYCSRYEPVYNKEKTQPSGGGIKNREQDGKWWIMMKFINNEKILEKYKKRYYNAQ